MANSIRIAAVLALCLLAAGCTPCGGWSKFSEFPKACNSGEAK